MKNCLKITKTSEGGYDGILKKYEFLFIGNRFKNEMNNSLSSVIFPEN